jgi:hypothetical protein
MTAAQAARRFRAALIQGDASAIALVAAMLEQDPQTGARWLKLAKPGRPRRDARVVELLRAMRDAPQFAALSDHAASDAMARWLLRFATSAWQFERDLPGANADTANGTPRDPRQIARVLGHVMGPRFPPSSRTIRRALAPLARNPNVFLANANRQDGSVSRKDPTP